MVGVTLLLLAAGGHATQNTWTQDGWSGGASGSAAIHPGDASGWNFYSQKDAYLLAGSSLTLAGELFSWVVTDNSGTDSGFGYIHNGITLSGSGSNANLSISRSSYPVSWGYTANNFTTLYSAPAGYDGADTIYYHRDGNANYSLKYSIPGNSWTPIATPGVGMNGSAMTGNVGGYLYSFRGANTVSFYRYSIAGNTWTQMAGAPAAIGSGGLVYPGSGDYIYALRGYFTTDFWRYSISSNSWSTLSDAPSATAYSAMVYPGSGDYIYALRGNSTPDFWRYSISGDTWDSMAATPAINGPGASLAHPGFGGYIYASQGLATTSVLRYSIVDNAWSSMPNTPVAINGGNALVADVSGNLFLAQNSNSSVMVKLLSQGYLASGVYTSPVFDTGGQFDMYDISWSSFMPAAGGSITVGVRAGDTPAPDGTWTAWQTFGNGASLGAAMDNKRYLQWSSTLTTVDVSTTPVLYDLTLRYQGYSSQARALVSSVFDTGSSSNSIRKLKWSEANPWPADSVFQLRSSPDGSAWTAWMGPDGTGSSYFTDPDGFEMVPLELRDGMNDRYFQYKAVLTGSGLMAPVVEVATVTYGSLSAPSLTGLIPDSSTQMTLQFTDTSDEEDGFGVSIGAVPGPANYAGYIATSDKPGAGAQSGAVTGLTPNTLYYFRLRANESAGGGYSAFSNELSAYTLAAPPAASTPYTPGASSIYVTWGANGNAAGTMYRLEYADNPAYTGSTQFSWTSGTGYTVPGLALGTTYYFKVKSRNGDGLETLPPTELHAAQPAADPSAVAIGYVGSSSVTLNWGQNGNAAYIPYKVTASTTAGFAPAFSTSPWVSGSSYMFTGLSTNTTYYFRVKAANPSLDEAANWVSLGSTVTLAYQPAYVEAPSPSEEALSFFLDTNGNPAGILYRRQASTDANFSVISSSMTAGTPDTWDSLSDFPGTIYRAGGLAVAGDYIFSFRGMNTTSFYRYSISAGAWSTMAAAPGTVGWNSNGALVYPGSGDYLYALPGYSGSPAFWRYSISQNVWETLQNIPALPGYGQSLVHYNGSIYAILGNGSTSFYRYSIVSGLWYTAPSAPAGISSGGAAVLGPDNNIYVLRGAGTNGFYRYSTASNSWSTMSSAPSVISSNASALASVGFGDHIYAFKGANTASFWRYSISANAWTAMNDAPAAVFETPACLAYSGGYLYGCPGNTTTAFWRYNLKPGVLAGLAPLTTYYVRAAALNSAGSPTSWTDFGPVRTKVKWPALASYSAGSDRITVNWSNPNPAPVEFYIERSSAPDFGVDVANSGWLPPGTTYYTFTGLTVSTEYYFRAAAREQAAPANVSAFTYYYPSKATAPNPPSSLSHAFVSSGTVAAQWGANGNGTGTEYYAESAPDAGFGLNVASSGWITAAGWSAPVTPNTYYYFRVKAKNATGLESSWTSLPSVRSYANVPGSPSVTGVMSAQAQFNWALNNDPSGTEFYAEIALTSSPWAASGNSGWVTSTSNLFTGLAANTTYYFRVKARNAALAEGINSLAPSAENWTVVISTLTRTPPTAPSGLAVDLSGISSAQYDRLHVSWLDNSANEDGFTLERSPDGSSFSPLLNLSAGSTEYTDTGLSANTSYYYRVKAYSAVSGDSGYSNIAALYTRADNPSAIQFAQVSSVTLGLGWSGGTNPGYTRYTAEISTMAGFTPLAGSSSTYNVSAALAALAPNTMYYARVKAANGNALDSDWTAAVSTVTSAAPPVNPAFLSVWRSSAGASWGDNANPGYTRYEARLSTAADFSGTVISSVTRNFWAEFTALAPDTAYYLRVRALNEGDKSTADVSPAQPAVTLAWPPAVSAAPYLVNASSVTVLWSTSGNPAWTQYKVQRSGKDSSTFSSIEDASLWTAGISSYTFYSPALSAGSTYYFRVKARNSAGVEAPEGAAIWTVLPSTQTLPNMPGAVPAEVFVSSINARWVNTNQAGTPYLAEISELSDYSVLAASSGWTDDIANYAFTGLAPNTRYFIRVRARNTSAVETARMQLYGEYTRAALPGAPVDAYIRAGNSVTLNWDRGGNPDPGTDFYAVRSSTPDFSVDTASSSWDSSNSRQFTGLQPGTTYYFRVKAKNRNSTPYETDWTVLPSTVTLPAPAPPTNIGLAYNDSDSTDRLSVSWTDNAAAPTEEAGFRIYESVDGGVTYNIKDTLGLNPGTGPLNYLVMGLSANTRYHYKVSAFNANGDAFTAALSTFTRAALPAAQDFTQVLTNSLRTNWGGNGNPAGTSYVCELSTVPGFVPLTASSTTIVSSALFSGVEANKLYYARVKAVNGSGVSTNYTALGSTQTIPLYIALGAEAQAPAGITQGERKSFAKLVAVPSGNGAQLNSVTVRRTGTSADADVARVAVWRDAGGEGGFQAGNDAEVGYGVFSGSQAAITINQTFSADTTFFVVLSAADNYLSWPDNTLGVTLASTASFTSPNSILSSLSPAPLNSGLATITKLADTLDVYGTNVAPVTNVSRGIYNTPFLKLTLNAARDRAFLNRIMVNKLGTLDESYIAGVKVFYDANKNGTLEVGAGDELISSGVDLFVSGQSVIQLVTPSTRPVASEVYFITLDIMETAPLNATVGVRVPNSAAFALMAGTPDGVTLAATPTDSGVPAVSDPPNILYVTPASMGVTTIAQGADKAFEKLDLTASAGNAVVTSLKVQRSSTSVDSDYTRVALYKDNPPLGEYGPSDTLITSGTFSSGQRTFNIAETITYTSTRTYFVAASVSPSANTSNKAGISIQSGYVTAQSAQTTIQATFPIYSGLADITPTIDTVMVTPDASIAPSIAYQTNTDVPVLALKLQADANAADISAVVINQAGTAQDADISGLRVFRDNGDLAFSPAQDTPVSGSYGFSNGSATISFTALQNITVSSSVYYIAAAISPSAVPGRTMQLRIASAGSFNILAPDIITSTFPIISNTVTLEKLPAVLYVSSTSLAPASAGAGTADIKMERLQIRTSQSTSRANSISLVRAGGSDADISGVSLYWDFNFNAVLEPSEMVSSGTFAGGFLALPFSGSAGDLSVSTKTYYVTMSLSPSASVGSTLGISFTNLPVDSPDSVEAGRFPFASGSVLVAEPPSTLLTAMADKMPVSVMQGDTAVLAASMTLRASDYTVSMTGMQVLRTGTGYDADITSVKLYADDGNGTWGGPAQETLLAQGTFASGAVTLNFSTQTITTASRVYYVAADISETAAINKTFGISLPAASYITVAAPDYADVAAFPFGSSLALLQPTVDTLQAVPVPLSLAPLLTQADYRRSIGKLTLRSDLHSVELSGIKFDQTGTMPDADLAEALLYKDDGDGVFVSTADTPVTFPTQLNAGSLQLLLSPARIINTTPQVFWLAISVSSTAAPGTTFSLDCPSTSYFSVTAPDLVDTSAFPFSFSVAGALLDKPDLVRVLPQNTAPAEADQGSAGNVMARLKVWTDEDQAVFNRLRVDLSGSVSPADISAVKLYKDLDSNGVLSGPDLMLSSAAFSAGYVWLDLSPAQTLTVTTQTYLVAYDLAAAAAINSVAKTGFAAASYVDVAAPDGVDGSSLPFTSGAMVIREPAAQVSLNFENKASTWALQGQMDVLMSSFTLAVSSYNAQLNQLIVRKTGNSPDADIAVYFYADNGNRTFGGFAQETLVASAPFSGGMATLQFSPVAFSAAAPKLFYLAAKVADGAQAGKTAGFSLDAANYVSIASPDYLDPGLAFPLATGAFEVQATVDTLILQAETLGLTPLLTQTDHRRAVGRLTLRASANSVELSGIRFSQGGTAAAADVYEALLYKDDGDGVFVSTADAAVTLPTQFSGQSLQFLMLSAQTVTTAPQVYWLALSVATNAAVGATISLNCANTTYLTLSAPDLVGASPFPFSISPAGSIQDKPDTVRILALDSAPSAADRGSANNVMARLKLWTGSDRASLNGVRVNLTGSVSGFDIAAVKLYRDTDYSGALSAADALLASGVFSGGTVWLAFGSPQSITSSTQTYFVAYDMAALAASGAQARAEISGAASLDVDSPDVVDASGLPFASGLMTINEPPAKVSVNFADKASTAAVQGSFDLLLASFTVTVSTYNASLTQLMVRRIGTGSDADAVLYLYSDGGDGAFGGYGLDGFISSAAFSGGVATLQFSPVALNSSSPGLFFLAAALSSGAQPNKTFGISLDAAGYLAVVAPDYIDPALAFPLATALTEIRPTSDTLLLQAESLNQAPQLTQGDSRRGVGKITLRSSDNSVEVSNIRFDLSGSAGALDITEFVLYMDDGDGVFLSTADAAVTLPAAASAGAVQLVFSPARAATTVPQVYWLAVSVDTLAAPGAELVLTCPNTGYVTVSSMDSVDSASLPLTIHPTGALQDKPDTMRVVVEDIALTSVYQGRADNPMARIRLWTDQDKAVLRRLRLDLAGSAASSDIGAVKLYADSDGNGNFDAAADAPLATGQYAGGYVWLDLASSQTISGSTVTFFAAYDIASSAVIDAQAGLSLSGAAYFDLDSPDTASLAAGFASKFSVVRDARIPLPPSITVVKGDGSLSMEEVAYNPYETMLKFKWDGTVYQGALERMEYNIGSTPAASTSSWTNIGLLKDAVVSNLNLSNGATYYLSLRAKNALGSYYSDIVSQRLVVDSFKPLLPACGNVKDEAGGVKVSWPEALTGASGLDHYVIEERSGSSPVWKEISTTTATSLIIAKSGFAPQSISRVPGTYYYRVKAVSGAGVSGEYTEPLAVNIDLDQLASITAVSAYPNPFDSRKRSVNINFTLNRDSKVEIAVYDVFGAKVKAISFGGVAGANETVWDGTDGSGRKVSKGMYICVIKAVGDKKTVKIGVLH